MNTIGDTIEIRVHGIGLHSTWDSLGEPKLVEGGEDVGSYSFKELRTDARSFVWSRTTRRSSLLWYLLLPFTLINLAGHMAGVDGSVRVRFYRLVTVVTGALLTVILLLWLVAIVDDFSAHITDYDWWLRIRSFGLLLVVAGLIAAITLGYTRRRRQSRSTFPDYSVVSAGEVGTLPLVANLSAVVLAVVAIFVVHPFTACQGQSEASCQAQLSRVVPLSDPLRDLLLNCVVLSIAVLVLCGIVLWAWPGQPRSSRRSEYAGLLVCWFSITLAGIYLASIRGAFDWLFAYLDFPAGLLTNRGVPFFRGMSFYAPPHIRGPWVLEQNIPGVLSPPALVAPYLFLGLLIFAILIIAAIRLEWGRNRMRHIGAAEKDYSHGGCIWLAKVAKTLSRRGLLSNLAARFARILPIFVVVWIGALIYAHMHIGSYSSHPIAFTIVAVSDHLLAALSFGFLLIFLWPAVRRHGSIFFDIAGLWPVAFHPLSAPSYGKRVIDELVRQVRSLESQGGVRLIGHSQGSVLAFEACHLLKPTDTVLVTCGSPLQRLYAEFFPRFYNVKRFQEVVSSTLAWCNVVRDTDPIGSPITSAENTPITEPVGSDPLLKHGGYWTNEAVLAPCVKARPGA